MAQRTSRRPAIRELIAYENEPIQIIPDTDENGEHIRRIVVGDDPTSVNERRREALFSLAGAWGDLDWEAMEEGLEQIRRSSRPSPPLDGV